MKPLSSSKTAIRAAIGVALLSAPLTLAGLVGTAQGAVGTPAAAGALAFTAQLSIGEWPENRACTATVVHELWVATAASCFADRPGAAVPAGKPARRTTVTLSGGTVLNVVELTPRTDRDLVLARLDRAAQGITPVALAATAPAAGHQVSAAGFGRTKTEWVPDKVHRAAFAVKDITGNELTLDAAHGSSALCKGDSGGPVLDADGKLVGVNSRSWQGGCLGVPATETRTGAVATRVDNLAQWITLSTGPRWGAENEGVGSKAQDLWGDFNGDGKSDTAVLHDYGQTTAGGNRSGLWTQAGNGTGFENPVKVWDSAASGTGSFSWDRSKAVAGDFNGDGKTDIGVLYNNGQAADGTSLTALWTFTSNGIGFDRPVKVWESTGSWNWDRSKAVAGDFNGDGKTDIGVLYNNGQAADGTSQTALWTFTSNGAGFAAPVKKWDNISAGTGSWSWDRSKPVAGDFNGDGKADVGVLYNLGQNGGNNLTALWTFASDGSGFGNPVKVWDNDDRTTGSWSWDRSKPVAGDFNGDGKADIGVQYNNGQTQDGRNQTTLWTLTSTGTGFGGPVKKWDSAADSWNWNTSKPGIGDFDGDGKADIGAYYDYGRQSDGTSRTGLWKFASTGTGFNAPAQAWVSDSVVR
ncbi:trypsin-like serine protease [Streptomyces nojiriensis]|uniref:trypsin-like serine protease n=1 Tax=Streptomyces nojiriensis TaxID=66374 RepID=UPI002E19FC3C